MRRKIKKTGKTFFQFLHPHRDLLLLMGLVAFFMAYLWNVPAGQLLTGTAVFDDDVNISFVHAQGGPAQHITNYVRLADGTPAVEEVVQMPAEIGKPVMWVQNIEFEDSVSPGRMPLPSGASTVTLTRIRETNFLTGFVVGAGDENVTLEVGEVNDVSLNVTIELPPTENVSLNTTVENASNIVDLPVVEPAPSLEVPVEVPADIPVPIEVPHDTMPVPETIPAQGVGPVLVVYENVSSVSVSFTTEAPHAFEREIGDGVKEVVISSTVHYENILAFTTVDDVPRESITLYRTTDGLREPTDIVDYDDTNADGLVDTVYWIVPSLSNQTYEVQITVINVKSFPVLGGNWTVFFNTTGAANLTISAVNGTIWGNNEDVGDLRFIEVRCGDVVQQYQWISDTVFIANYSCAVNSSEVSKTLTEGGHNLMFTFGGDVAFAFNDVNTKATVQNVTLNTTLLTTNDTDTNVTLYFNSSDTNAGDQLKNITDWRVNSSGFTFLNMPFENGSSNASNSSFARDYSFFGNNGTVFGAVMQPTGGFDGFGAYSFDGKNDVITTNIPDFGQAGWSIEFWMLPRANVSRSNLSGDICVVDTGAVSVCIARDDFIQVSVQGNDTVGGWNHSGPVADVSSGEIYSMVVWNNSLYVGGGFGSNKPNISRYDGVTTWTSIGNISPTRTEALTVWNGTLYAGENGDSSTPVGAVYRYDGGTTWTQVGRVLTSLSNSNVNSLVAWNGSLYAAASGAGGFSNASVFRYDGGTTWTHVGGGSSGAMVSSFGLTAWNGTLFLVDTGTRVYRYEGGNSWTDLGLLMGGSPQMGTMTLFNGSLYLSAGTTAPTNGSIFRYENRDTAVGNFTFIGQLTEGNDGPPAAMAAYNGTLYAVGATSSPSGRLYQWNGTGFNSTPIASSGSPTVRSMAVWNGSLMIATTVSDGFTKAVVYRYGNGTTLRSTKPLWDGGWQHVVVTRNVTDLKLYLNGVLNSTMGMIGTHLPSLKTQFGSMRIGSSWGTMSEWAGGNDFNGTIDELRIYNRSLTDDQVWSHWTNRTDVIALTETSNADVWQACVTANDRTDNGNTTCSATLSIIQPPPPGGGGNNKSTVQNVTLNTTTLTTNDSDVNLTLYFNASDLDAGDQLKNITDWRVNWTSFASLNMPFENGTNASNNTFARDYSFFGNNGTGDATIQPLGGYDGFGAYSFDGDYDYMTTALPEIGSQGFSIEFRALPAANISRMNFSSDICAIDAGVVRVCFTRDGFVEAMVTGNDTNVWNNSGTPGENSNHLGFAVWNGSLYAIMGGSNGGNISRYNGVTNWTSIGQLNTDKNVNSIAVWNNTLYAGEGGSFAQGRVFRYDGGTTWTEVGEPLTHSADVNALVTWNGSLYAGVSGNSSETVARYDGGTTWTSIEGDMGASENPITLIVWNGSLYCGMSGGPTYRYNGGSSWISLGKVDGRTQLDSMVVWNGSLYATAYSSTPGANQSLFRYNGTDGSNNNWTWQGQFLTNPNNIYSLAAYNGTLYAAGSTNSQVFKWNGTDWNFTSLGSSTGAVRGLAVWNGSLWAGTGGIGGGSEIVILRYGNGSVVRSTNKLWENVYQHVVVTRNASTLNLYLNGVLNASLLWGAPLSSFSASRAVPLQIGRTWGSSFGEWTSGGDFNGTLDELRIYNRTLGPKQIWALYTNQTNVIDANETKTGEVWQACVTANDVTADGNTTCSNNVSIREPASEVPADPALHVPDSDLNATNISVVGKLTGFGSGTQGFMIQWVNVSGTMFFNVTMNSTNSSSQDASWNVTNVSVMFRHNQNESIMGNFTGTNSTVDPGNAGGLGIRGPKYWNVSVDTSTMPDGVYRIFILMNNFSNAGTGAGANPRTNATIAINVSIDNSPPNTSVTGDATGTSQNLTAPAGGANVQGFNATVSDASFYYLHASANNGTNIANITFSFDNTSASPSAIGFNITVGQGGAGIGGPSTVGGGNMTQVNTTTAIWNVSVNLSALHAGEHTVRIFAYNWHGKLNLTRTFNFTLNTPHNVTYMSSPTGEVVTQFANYSARNTYLMFNISVINATTATSGFPNAPIFTVIGMFDNASGNDFNLSNGTNRFSDLNIAGVGYWNLSYNVSALEEGNNTATFFVNDTLGNHNKTTYVSFTVDKSAPNVSMFFMNVSNGTTYLSNTGGRIMFNTTLNDSLTSVQTVLFGFTNDGNNTEFNVTTTKQGPFWYAVVGLGLLTDGTYRVRVYGNDLVNNLNYTVANVSFTMGSDPLHNFDAGLNATNISVVGKVVQDNAAPLFRWVNASGTMFFNVTMNSTNGSSQDASWNVTNVSVMFRHNQNESIMANFTGTNSTVDPGNAGGLGLRGPKYWNVSVDTATLPDGVYNVLVLMNNWTAPTKVAAGQNPRTNATIAVNVSIDNSPPNVSVTGDATATPQNLTAVGNAAANENVKGFNATVSDASFYYLHTAGVADPANISNGTNVANVTFSFDNTSGSPGAVGFNITVGQGGAGGGQGNMTPTNSTNAIWNVSVNLSALHAGEHSVRVFAYNWHGKLNFTRTFNFTLNTPHNVTYMSSPTGEVVTQFANYSARNTYLMFNISVINATNATTGFPNAPIFAVIGMFDNASGNDFNLSNGSNRVSDLNTAGVGYWNLSYNVSALQEGNNTVTFFVNDTLGNHNKTTSVSFTVDKSAPNVSMFFMNISNETTYNTGTGVIMFNTTLNDSLTSVQTVLFGFTNDANSTEFNVSTTKQGPFWYAVVNLVAMTNGNYRVRVYGNDSVNNLNYTVANVSFTVSTLSDPALHVPDSDLNTTNISIVGKAQNGANNAGLNIQWFNASGTMFFNVTMNSTNGSSQEQSWNVTNVSIMFRHGQNQSIMGNFTGTNSTVAPGMVQGLNPKYWNVSVDTATLPDGVYNVLVLMNNWTTPTTVAAGQNPRTNLTIAVNVSIDNSPPNVTIPADTATSQNLSAVGNGAIDAHQKSFNASVHDASFYYLHGTGPYLNGTNVANVTFSFDNTSVTIGFNLTATAANNIVQVNGTNSTYWNISVNLSALHAGEHTVRVFTYNWHGKLNSSGTFNFTLNTPHNVTYMSSPTGEVVTKFANFSARNTYLMFNISVINATNTTTGFPNAPIVTVIAMFNNASGNDFNLSNGSNRVSDLNIAGVGYWNLSYNVSALEEGNNTATFFVNDTLGNHNKTTYVSFTVDKSAPNVSNLYVNVSNGTNFTRTGVIQINASVNETYTFVQNVTFEIINRHNGTQFNVSTNKFQGSYTLDLALGLRADGVYDVRVYANDTVNNVNNSLQNVSFTVDGTAPNVSNLYLNVSNGTNFTRSGVIQINATINDTVTTIINVSFEIINRINATQFNVTAYKVGGFWSANLTLSDRGDGVYDVRVYANDTLNNVNNTLQNASFTVDGTAPNVTNLYLNVSNGTNFTRTGVIQINASVNDSVSTIQNVTFEIVNRINGTPFNVSGSKFQGSYTADLDLALRADGLYDVRVYANDTLANTNNSLQNVSFTVDGTAPNVSNLYLNFSNGTNFTRAGVVQINATVNDTVTTIQNVTFEIVNRNNGTQFNVSGNKFQGYYTVDLVLGLRADGVYDIRVYANDTLNNFNNTLQNVSFTVDGTAPNVSNLYINFSNGTNFTRTGVVQINATVNDSTTTIQNVTFEIINRNNGTLFNVSGNKFQGSYTLDLALGIRADGVYDVRVYANDTLANTNDSLQNVSFTVDGTSPNVTSFFMNVSNGTTYHNSGFVMINATLNDMTTTVETVLFGLENSVNGTQFNLSTTKQGSYWYATVNLSGLSAATYTIRIYGNDTLNNLNNSVQNTSFIIDTSDGDHDGVPDVADNCIGNESNVTTTGVTNLNITIAGNTTNGSFTDNQAVVLYDGTTLIANFTHNFSKSVLRLTNLSVTVAANSVIMNFSNQLIAGETKTMYITDNAFASLCVEDAQISSADDISSACTGTNETNFDTCIGNSAGVTLNGITCYDDGAIIRVVNMSHSGVEGAAAQGGGGQAGGGAPSGGSGGGGGGGGGGGRAAGRAVEDEPVRPPQVVTLPSELTVTVVKGKTANRELRIVNLENTPVTLDITVEGDIPGVLSLNRQIVLGPNEEGVLPLSLTGDHKGLLTGKVVLRSGNYVREVPVIINIKSENFLFDVLLSIAESYRLITEGDVLRAQVTLSQIGPQEAVDVTAHYVIKDFLGNLYREENETFSVVGSQDFVKEFDVRHLTTGDYVLGLELVYPGAFATSSTQFSVVPSAIEPTMYVVAVLGILVLISLIIIGWVLFKRKKMRNLLRRR